MPPCAQAGNSGVLSLGPELLAEVPITQFNLPVVFNVDLAAFASVGFAVLFDQVVSISWKAFSAFGLPLQAFWIFTVAQMGREVLHGSDELWQKRRALLSSVDHRFE